MNAFLYGAALQWKLDFRNKEIVVTYYLVPIVFFLFMGGIFTSILTDFTSTLIPAMTVFGVTMGGVLGSPAPLAKIYGSEIKKSYRAGNIPLWTAMVGNFISGFIHLFLMSLVIFFVAPLLFHATVPTNLVVYFSSLALLIIASVSIGTVFGLYVNSPSKLAMITQFAFLPSIMLSGIMFPANLLPSFLQMIGKIFPASWAYQAMCSNTFELGYIFPILIIITVLLILSILKLRLIEKE